MNLKLLLSNINLRNRLYLRRCQCVCLRAAIHSLRLALKAAWKIKRYTPIAILLLFAGCIAWPGIDNRHEKIKKLPVPAKTNIWGKVMSQDVPMPPAQPQTARQAALAAKAALLPPAPPKTNWLVWRDTNMPGTRFEVWHTTNLTKSFTFLTNTPATNYAFQPALPLELFAVRATNQFGVSAWATK